MITVKIHCDDCKQDIDVTCEGIYFLMKNPSSRPGESYRNDCHNINPAEILPRVLRYLLPDIIGGAIEDMENVNFREWLKNMGVNLE